ncbi:hypothetical protein [Actinoplanes palleronii]|uniref:Uncharacterized protein n=1 Tax=Actinoplanes palleronii TaxID=113570 RepID=A0ABQ4B3Z7_9ACTN|nr:hypothetical protein [Actinoplanes palleronii]GIE65378.1 hypothetical protein Apa02nite_014860 [Actinoplanes palleronii]
MIRPLRLVALDLSMRATAIASTHSPKGAERLAVYTVANTEGRPLHVQIDEIEAHVRQSCGFGTGGVLLGGDRPDLVIIEGTFSRIGGSDYPLHALHGVIKQWLYRRQIPYAEVAPSTVKVWATGSGATSGENKVTKDKVIKGVLATYGHLLNINPRDDNQADAVSLLTLGAAAYGQPLADAPQNRQRAIRSVTWPDLAQVVA